jgi:plastocyanin
MTTSRVAKRASRTAAVAALIILGACGGSEAPPSSEGNQETAAVQAEIKDFDFQPEPVRAEVGGTVSWTNEDDILHTITSGIGQEQGVPGVSKNKDAKPDGLFDQEMDGVGSTFSFTFDKAGEYDYYCAIHPGMRGTVIVD